MKWILSVILFLFAAHFAFPQFNSIEFQKELTSVKVTQLATIPTHANEVDLSLLSLPVKLLEKERVVVLVSPPLDDFSLTSDYGYRSDPFSKTKTFHRGIDLSTNRSKVYSILHGKVVSVGNDPLLGDFVKVQHGKYESIYGHLSQVMVSLDDNVLPGSVLGISGGTGKATGDHLHLTIKKGNEFINPILFIQMISKLANKDELITYLSIQ